MTERSQAPEWPPPCRVCGRPASTPDRVCGPCWDDGLPSSGRDQTWDDPGCVRSLSCVGGLHSLGCPASSGRRQSHQYDKGGDSGMVVPCEGDGCRWCAYDASTGRDRTPDRLCPYCDDHTCPRCQAHAAGRTQTAILGCDHRQPIDAVTAGLTVIRQVTVECKVCRWGAVVVRVETANASRQAAEGQP